MIIVLSIVGPKDALQEASQVGDVLCAQLHVLMVTALCPVRSGWSLGQFMQMPACLYVHHIVLCPLQHAAPLLSADFKLQGWTIRIMLECKHREVL